MSWYQAADGHEVWVPRNETVYTVIEPSKDLPHEELMYLSMTTNKPVFQELSVEDDSWDIGRNKKRHMKRAGKERGYLLRVETDGQARVIPWFKAACKQLIAQGFCSKIDVAEAVNLKKQKKLQQKGLALGVNECRVETLSRCTHVACGPGFKVEISCDQVTQHMQVFTDHRVLPTSVWHAHVLEAVGSVYGRVFAARKVREGEREDGDDEREEAECASGVAGRGVLAAARTVASVAQGVRDAQRVEEEQWLATLMGSELEAVEGGPPTAALAVAAAAPGEAAAMPPATPPRRRIGAVESAQVESPSAFYIGTPSSVKGRRALEISEGFEGSAGAGGAKLGTALPDAPDGTSSSTGAGDGASSPSVASGPPAQEQEEEEEEPAANDAEAAVAAEEDGEEEENDEDQSRETEASWPCAEPTPSSSSRDGRSQDWPRRQLWHAAGAQARTADVAYGRGTRVDEEEEGPSCKAVWRAGAAEAAGCSVSSRWSAWEAERAHESDAQSRRQHRGQHRGQQSTSRNSRSGDFQQVPAWGGMPQIGVRDIDDDPGNDFPWEELGLRTAPGAHASLAITTPPVSQQELRTAVATCDEPKETAPFAKWRDCVTASGGWQGWSWCWKGAGGGDWGSGCGGGGGGSGWSRARDGAWNARWPSG
mmetsp:Transcript_163112/g.523059  ORF Transcript_163112/g.523059 Transcript_163112/m.523059 type:complete len:652 (+) Transcript_163112:162-2117(+)